MGLLCFRNLNVCFLSQVRKIFSNYFSYKFSVSFSLFLFWNSYNSNVSMLNIVPMSLKISFFLNYFFLFAILTTLFFRYLIHSSVLINLMLILCSVFFFSFQLLYYSALIGSFLYFLTLCWSYHCVPLFFFTSLMSIPITIT